jgi:hypothetical protein
MPKNNLLYFIIIGSFLALPLVPGMLFTSNKNYMILELLWKHFFGMGYKMKLNSREKNYQDKCFF